MLRGREVSAGLDFFLGPRCLCLGMVCLDRQKQSTPWQPVLISLCAPNVCFLCEAAATENELGEAASWPIPLCCWSKWRAQRHPAEDARLWLSLLHTNLPSAAPVVVADVFVTQPGVVLEVPGHERSWKPANTPLMDVASIPAYHGGSCLHFQL